MIIPGYKYIAHKIIPRVWGIECRFTVKKDNDPDINDIVILPTDKIMESEIVKLISQRLMATDHPRIDNIPEKIYTKSEIEQILIDKGYLQKGQTLDSLQAKVGIK